MLIELLIDYKLCIEICLMQHSPKYTKHVYVTKHIYVLEYVYTTQSIVMHQTHVYLCG